MMDDDKYIEASWIARIICLLIVTIGIGLHFWSSEMVAIDPANDYRTLQQLKDSNLEFERLNNFLEIFLSVMFLSFSIYFVQIGIRSFRSEEFPPSNSLVIIKTKVMMGKFAKGISCGYLVMGVAFIGFTTWLNVYAFTIFT